MAEPTKSFGISPAYSFPGDCSDSGAPLQRLETVRMRMDSLRGFLAESVDGDIILRKDQMDAISSEISAAIAQIVVNGSALLSCLQQPPAPYEAPTKQLGRDLKNPIEKRGHGNLDDCDVIELDAVEILAEHVHFCEICGKGFKRDANLRMHMRAHGDQYKTTEALSKPRVSSEALPQAVPSAGNRKTLFSCPHEGCNRNRRHKRFRPLKSVICVRNHFKRSHCPKLFPCQRCQKKSFSVLADLKGHQKHCGKSTSSSAATAAPTTRWRCSCGTSFTRKDKLFGHVANFEGHMPAVTAGQAATDMKAAEEEAGSDRRDDWFSEEWLEGFDQVQDFCFEDIMRSPVRFSYDSRM